VTTVPSIERSFSFTTRDGILLEGRLYLPETAAGGLVVCHPHPLYGGDMENPVVAVAADVGRAAGLATLRFNFRGVGRSGGTHGHGEAEPEDAEAALGQLERLLPVAARVGVAGYSFGAAVAARAAARRGDVALALIAPPLGVEAYRALPRIPDSVAPILVIAGTRDEYCSASTLHGLRREVPRVEVVVVEGADHFFAGRLPTLRETLARWARAVATG
jgi:uncharacterized protein